MCAADRSAECRISKMYIKYCLANGKRSLCRWEGVKWFRCFLSYEPKHAACCYIPESKITARSYAKTLLLRKNWVYR